MGSFLELTLVHHCSQPPKEKLYVEINNLLERLDSELSLYQPGSAINELNKNGVIHNASKDFILLLELAKDYYKKSNGLFNICIETLNNKNLKPEERSLPLPTPFDITHQGKKIFFNKPLKITFDGIAKGYAVDLVYTLLKDTWAHFLINFSGNMRFSGARADNSPWQILAWNKKERRHKQIDTRRFSAVATSGNEHSPGHVINPITKKRITEITPASALCKTAVAADVFSTVFFIDPTVSATECELF
jgi:thiamine biosynthesis lipoprotein